MDCFELSACFFSFCTVVIRSDSDVVFLLLYQFVFVFFFLLILKQSVYIVRELLYKICYVHILFLKYSSLSPSVDTFDRPFTLARRTIFMFSTLAAYNVYNYNIEVDLVWRWIKERKKAKNQELINQIPQLTQDATRKSDKTKEIITYKRAKTITLCQQVTTRLQWTDKRAWQTQNINDKKDPQKKHRIGTVSKIFLLEGWN